MPPQVKAYTILLFILGGLALLVLASHTFLIIPIMQEEAEPDPIVLSVFRFLQVVEVFLSVSCIAVGILRVFGFRLARPATAAISILLFFWLPFGTAAFLYWVFWVRKRERGPDHIGVVM